MIIRTRFTLTILTAVVALAYCAYWFFASQALLNGVAGWADEMRAKGYGVSMGEVSVGGFPLNMRFDVTDFVLDIPFGQAPFGGGAAQLSAWRVSASDLSVDKRPWEMGLVNFSLPGTYQLTRESKDGQLRSFFAVADKARGSISLDYAGQPTAALLWVSGLSAATEKGPFGDEMRLGEGQISLRHNLQIEDGEKNMPTFSLALSMTELYLSAARSLPLGPKFPRVEAQALLMGDLPADLPGDSSGGVFEGPVRQAATLWRDGGGTVEVPTFTIDWGALEMEGDGTLALDENLQPMGALATRIRGFDKTLKSLSREGVVSPTTAATAGIIFGLLAKPAADGGAKVLKAPLSVQDRNLFIGPVKLLKLPLVEWK